MKFDIDTYREIIDTITRNKTRSFLTGFGVFWGVFMLILPITATRILSSSSSSSSSSEEARG